MIPWPTICSAYVRLRIKSPNTKKEEEGRTKDESEYHMVTGHRESQKTVITFGIFSLTCLAIFSPMYKLNISPKKMHNANTDKVLQVNFA